MTSDQEAVCGTCGVYRVRIDKSCPHCGADFIPPPVVPSDDRLPVLCVKVQGTGATWVCNRPSYDVVHQNVNNARPGSGKHDFKPPTSPTPSQDATVRFRCGGCGVWLREDEMISPHGGKRDGHVIPGSVPDYCGPVNEVIPPSQDAEGDGWRKKREDGEFGVWADFYQGRPISPFYVVPHGVESAIREPYEALVKATRKAYDDEYPHTHWTKVA